MEEENQYLKGKLEKLERENKANNIIIYGAPKTILTVDALKIEINNLVGVNLDTHEVKNFYFLGNSQSAPLKVKLNSYFKKREILQNRKNSRTPDSQYQKILLNFKEKNINY